MGDLMTCKINADTSNGLKLTSDTSGSIDLQSNGNTDISFASNALNIKSGTTLTIDSGATIANSGTATGFVGGKVLQVVQATDNTAISQSNNTEYTQLRCVITPAASSSKILLFLSIGCWSHSGTLDSSILIKRDSTSLQVGSGGTNDSTIAGSHNTGTNEGVPIGATLLDSPSTTSEITYGVFGIINSGSFVINKRNSSTITATSSRLIAVEIGA